ncbi:MAG: tRNA (adenosine(37)-N6)-threonylcarbamoyltransferase complex dimerization subunit type 1 TsaB [Bacteroidetes bacterium SW_9_63_38]|nr:MAG: tRNA (adenosine(37)-N6)-threonylcarbamoyltransferase complex dimerization subunit type 1 TsaB [Bacteroidetes bacterium SW_9_63_38]
MTLLALETATTTCGTALLREGRVLVETHLHRPRVHSERLTPLIEDVLRQADVAASALDAVAVSMGPGSYTGLRIGVSTAKGWALSTGADLVGVPTLEAYAAQCRPMTEPGDVVAALLDARRDEVYAGAFRRTADGLVEHAPTKALTVDALADWIGTVEGRLWLVGDGGEKSRAALDDTGTNRRLLTPDIMTPSAAWVGRCGHRRLVEEGGSDVASVEPLYVKEVHATPSPSPFA